MAMPVTAIYAITAQSITKIKVIIMQFLCNGEDKINRFVCQIFNMKSEI